MRRRRSRERDEIAELRDDYAAGRIELEDFELAVAIALRRPKMRSGVRSPSQAAANWQAVVTAKAWNYSAAATPRVSNGARAGPS